MDIDSDPKNQDEVISHGPVKSSQRIPSLDILRGAAVLGILAMNIYSFALPETAYENPLIYGGDDALNLGVWKFTNLFFSLKFMTIFSMLFGAGMMIMTGCADEAGIPVKKIYFRRLVWLMVFGLLHGFLLWWGDILFLYGVCGFMIFGFRNKSARKLIIWGLIFLIIGSSFLMLGGVFFGYTRQAAERVRASEARGETPDDEDLRLKDAYDDFREQTQPSPDKIDKEISANRSGWWPAAKYRAPFVIQMQTQSLIFFGLWRAGGMMLLGMALFKMGIITAARSRKYYLLLSVFGYALGLSLSWYGGEQLLAHNFDPVYKYKIGILYNYFGSLPTALGHIGLIMLCCKSGILIWLKRSLASVGQMAFSNYLMQTFVMTFIFYGLGFFARVDRFGLMFFVLGMWVLQMIVSPLWLRYFRFGPAEWLWRSLTYRKVQGMRVKR